MLKTKTCDHTNLPFHDARIGHPHLEEMPTEDAIRTICDTCDDLLPMTHEDWCRYWLNVLDAIHLDLPDEDEQ